jgi:hypothetical protein
MELQVAAYSLTVKGSQVGLKGLEIYHPFVPIWLIMGNVSPWLIWGTIFEESSNTSEV